MSLGCVAEQCLVDKSLIPDAPLFTFGFSPFKDIGMESNRYGSVFTEIIPRAPS